MASKKKRQIGSLGSARKKRIIRALWKAAGGLCQRCKCKTGIASDLVKEGWTIANDLVYKDKEFLVIASIEHLTARCLGGTNAHENLALYCVRCNSATNPKKRPPETKQVPGHVGSSLASICGLRDPKCLRPKGARRTNLRKSSVNPDTIFIRMHRRKVSLVDTGLHPRGYEDLEGPSPLASSDETGT